VALQYASKQLTRLLLSSSLRRRWALGPDNTLRVLDYVTRVEFDDAVTTAGVNFLRDCIARISPRFFRNFIITIEDLMGVLLHERDHYLLVGMVYPMITGSFPSDLPHNLIDDILINALVRALCFTDVFERFYLGASGNAQQVVVTDATSIARGVHPMVLAAADLPQRLRRAGHQPDRCAGRRPWSGDRQATDITVPDGRYALG
jgi:hypothetical protein